MFKSKQEGSLVYKCTVRLLDDSDVVECEFQAFHKGIYLLDYLCGELNIKEKDYFGLRYVDGSKQRHWLDLAKSLIKQSKDLDPILFSLRVKFYPADPFRLTGISRIMLYKQLKRDLRHGRLYCSFGEAAALGALIVQEELGDYNEKFHIGDYVSSLELALRQTENLEKKIMELHKKREAGQDSFLAIHDFLGIARTLETYGIEPHPVKDHRGSQLYVGINNSGISTFIAGKRSQHFRWNEVHKINFEGKMFIAHLSYTDASREPKKHTIGFKCPSGAACRYLWRCAIEQMLFFTLPNSENAAVVSGGGFFSWGTKFRYTGRTEREILTENINALREQKINGSSSSKRKASSVPATPSSPQGELSQIRYSSLPRSTMSEPLGSCNVQMNRNHIYGAHPQDQSTCIIDSNGCIQMPILEPVCEESRLRSSNHDSANYFSKPLTGFPYRELTEHSSAESGSGYDQSRKHKENMKQYTGYASRLCYPQANSNSSAGMTVPKNVDHSSNMHTNSINGVKTFRKFHLLHAFIPSVIFVAFAMAGTAVFIMESESDLFDQIRNSPEMICLRFQYYQPLKDFVLQKFGRKD
ncbi:FERM domain-containing protein 5 isoform X1 [Drosophila subobscura]|uniref:FERM domain-containing protein 5 isoform X1 n=1 Tax=Drosophila subobscura TaxID=7241 RepID=UPI00155A685A|nr:FERM domain-containing protein 5 isoform X1 [Drosophila subobscura]